MLLEYGFVQPRLPAMSKNRAGFIIATFIWILLLFECVSMLYALFMCWILYALNYCQDALVRYNLSMWRSGLRSAQSFEI
mgnify:FL=1